MKPRLMERSEHKSVAEFIPTHFHLNVTIVSEIESGLIRTN